MCATPFLSCPPAAARPSGRLSTLKCRRIPDLTKDPEFIHRAAAAFSGLCSAVAVPMLRDGQPIGSIAVGRAETGLSPSKQIDLLTTFADQAVIAIENVRLFEEVQARTAELARSVGELEALGEVSQAVNSTLDLDTVLRDDRGQGGAAVGHRCGRHLCVQQVTRQQFRLRATFGMSDELIAAISDQTIGLNDLRDWRGRTAPRARPDSRSRRRHTLSRSEDRARCRLSQRSGRAAAQAEQDRRRAGRQAPVSREHSTNDSVS